MNRPSEKNLAKLSFFLCIVFGAILLFIADSMPKAYASYIMILGFAMLMFGLYKSTTSWVKENPRESKQKDSYVFYEEDSSLNKDQ